MTSSKQPPASEKHVEEVMSKVLRWGICITSLIVFIGAIGFLSNHALEMHNYKNFTGTDSNNRTLSGIISSAFSLNWLGVIQIGLLLLIFVPIVRVAVSIYTFAKQKDSTYVVISAIVLGVLLYSFIKSNL
jgi:uncharacterized membrane protein